MTEEEAEQDNEAKEEKDDENEGEEEAPDSDSDSDNASEKKVARLEGMLEAKKEQITTLKTQLEKQKAVANSFKRKLESVQEKEKHEVNKEFENAFPKKDISNYSLEVKKAMLEGYNDAMKEKDEELENSTKNGRTPPTGVGSGQSTNVDPLDAMLGWNGTGDS